jgi:UDP-N-acetylmuramate--alanine ligase
VTAILDYFGISVEQVDISLSTFKGVKRRNEVAGSFRGAKVVFDYAHHPTQIEGILSTYNNKNLVVFQPHTYSRTKAYFDDFVTALSKADTLIVVDTYGARESACDGVESVELAKEISTKFASTKVYHAKTHLETIDLVNKVCFGFDNLLFLGAGDIYELKDKLDYDKQG